MIERDKEYYNQRISGLYAVIDNQEKIIRDLQEEVKGYQTMYFDKVMIINEVIDYINNLGGIELMCMSNLQICEVLEILKGDLNE